MARVTHGPQAVTANRLTDGVVVWRTADGRWSEAFADAALLEGAAFDAALAAAHADALARLVIEPYGASVNGGAPASVRERIRADGPSIPFGPAS